MAGRDASRLGRGALRHEGSGGGVGDGGGAPCWALLLPGLGWLRPEVVEDVLEGVRLALLRWRLAWACAWVWQRAEAAVRRRARPAVWRRSWVFGRVAGVGFALGHGGGGGACEGTDWGACLEGLPRGLGGGVLDGDVVVVADEEVFEKEVVELEAGETDVGDAGGSQAGAGAGCWVL